MSAHLPIIPHLWFDTQAEEAADFYVSLFPGSRVIDRVRLDVVTPSGNEPGDVITVYFELAGQPFAGINGGPHFSFNPSVSLFVNCDSAEEADRLFAALSEGGLVRMPLGAYPFSEKFGWTDDRFGLSWQIHLGAADQKVVPCLLFADDHGMHAEEAMRFYTGLLEDARIEHIERYADDEARSVPGSVKQALFRLRGSEFRAMDSVGHAFGFSPAVSFMILCQTQAEIDRFWAALSANPEAEQCGWLEDRFGVSWQVTPAALLDMLKSPDRDAARRVTEAYMPMKKLEIDALERAFAGEAD